MHVYLAGFGYIGDILERAKNDAFLYKNERYNFYRLDSFYYPNLYPDEYVPKFKGFMLDSGAFSYMSGAAMNSDIDKFCDDYIRYINRLDAKLFMELDVDMIFGYSKALELRRWIEKSTGKQVIPVWHENRGKQAFIDMCRDYPYVAFGGLVSGETRIDKYKYLPWFIDTAHEHGAKIHGLGFTRFKTASWLHWDSVDSSSWTISIRFGYTCHFNGRSITQILRPERIKKSARADLAYHSFREWVKLSHYAETHY